MFLWREPLVPRWAAVKEVAKSQLTLLPNCKEPGCVTLLAALSIPEEVFLSGVQTQPPPRAARSGLQLGEARVEACDRGGGQEKTQPGQLEPRLFQSPTLLLRDVSVLVSVPPHPRPSAGACPRGWGNSRHGRCLQRVVPSVTPRECHWPAQGADPRLSLPCLPLPESVGIDASVHPSDSPFFHGRRATRAAKICFAQVQLRPHCGLYNSFGKIDDPAKQYSERTYE